jgi:hypothetical protein
MMTEKVTEPKMHLALDTNWMTAVFMAFCFVLCLLTIASTTRHVLIGSPVEVKISWETAFLFVAFGWLALQMRERITKFGCVLLSIVLGSRLILALFHSSLEVQTLNAQIMRVVELVVMIGFCYYLARWFKQRVRRLYSAAKAKHS